MRELTRICCLLAGFFCAFSAGAQDIIHKKNGQIVEAKVVELGTAEVKYRLFNQADGPIYVVEKESLLKIIFQDGHTEFYGQARIDATELFAGQKKSNLKISFLGPLLGYTNLTFERNIKPGRSWEVKAVIVGLGKRQPDRPRGFLASGAYKFYKKPTFYTTDMRRSHLLQGAYIKPEIYFGPTSYDLEDIFGQTGDTREHSFAVGLLLNLGKQWIFDDAFVLDLSGGIGYGSGTSTRAIYSGSEDGFGLAGTLTLNVGWMIR